MQDKALYDQILGLASPWSVARVELDVENKRVDVFLEHVSGVTFACPECEAAACHWLRQCICGKDAPKPLTALL